MSFGNMGTIFAELGLDTTKFNQGMKLAESRVALAGRKMKTIGRTLTMGVSLPLMAVGVAATKAGMDFDDSMTKSLAIMNNVSPQIRRQMEQTAKDVVDYTTFSAKEGADAYFYLASAGLDAAQSIEALPRVARFAQAGNFDLARATDLLTDAQSALGLTIRDDVVANMENMIHVSDVLVKANTLSNATVQQFSESLTNKAGAAMKLLNIDIEEGVAVLSAWADQGVKGALAGNYLNIVTRDLQRAAIKGEDAFKDYGISVFDASGNFRNMADIITDLEVALDGMSDKEKRATLMMLGFQDRSISAMMTLLGTSDAIRGYEKDLRSATGFTDDVAKKQMESFTAQVEQLKNELINIGIQIFDILRPQLEGLVEQVKRGIDWFDGLTDGQKKLAVNIGLVAAALGPALLIFGQLAVTIPRVTKGVLALNTAIKGGLLFKAGAVAAPVAVLAGAMYGFEKSNNVVVKSIIATIQPLSTVISYMRVYKEVVEEQRKGNLGYFGALKKLIQGIFGVGEATEEATKEYDKNRNAMRGMEEASKNAAKGHEVLAIEAEKAEEAIEEEKQAVDDLRKAFNELINEIFRITNAENALQEANWALEDAQKAVTEAIEEYGEGSRETEEAINDCDEALQNKLRTLGELYTEEGISIQRQQELQEEFVNTGLAAVENGEMGAKAFWSMAIQFGLTEKEIERIAKDIGLDLDEMTKPRTIRINIKVSGKKVPVDISPYVDPATLQAQVQQAVAKETKTTYKAPLSYGESYMAGLGVYKQGGLPKADRGMVTSSMGGDIPIIAHKNEVVLNPQQQAKLLFEIAKGQNIGGGGTNKPLEIRNIIELDSAVVYEKIKKIDDFNRDRIVE